MDIKNKNKTKKKIKRFVIKLDDNINNINILKAKKRLENLIKYFIYYRHKETLKESEKRLWELKNKHKGQKCFIVATGPSLKKTDLSFLKNEIIFGMNTLYKALDRFESTPLYWGVIDENVFEEHHKQILQLDATIFISGDAGRYFLKNKNKFLKMAKNEPIIIRSRHDMYVWKKISKDVLKGINGGRTVTIDICIQMAYWMGFSEVYLIGCDTDYTKDHHFDGKRHIHQVSKGSPWTNKMDLKRVLESYEICKKEFEQDGRKIYNATVGGKLEVFERKSLEEIFNVK